MEQKHKNLLVKDLCARLPYGVKCNINFNQKDGILTTELLQGVLTESVSVKPYLRLMSSMTKKELSISYLNTEITIETIT